MQSRATAEWQGDLMTGKGKTSAASGTFRDAELSWKARTEGAAHSTTPEELLAAAHASCFSMALSHGLAQGGHPPKRLETSCVVEFGPKRGRRVRGEVEHARGEGLGAGDRRRRPSRRRPRTRRTAAPISAALKIPMSVKAALQQ